ncbi:hypothetical protein GCM10022408_08820 [Hymenobacter fastidiosus]|uniref:TerB-C domain-containing protein n=1 Tax=Hymenobacter fastidiosus TaxID=486264 RepID=A0ABP7RNH8_9BACT
MARQTTVRLYVAVLHELELGCKKAGSTLLKRVKQLEEETEHYDHHYYNYRYMSRDSAGPKVGAAVFLTLFQRCENAVRERYGFRLLDADLYFSEKSDPDQRFNHYFGDVLPALLAPLAQALPAPDPALEQALNLADPKRWLPRFQQLLAYLPAQPAQFVEEVYALGQQNERNPNVATIYQQAAWELGAAGQQATLRLYLHYLYHGARRHPFKPKPLLKRLQKALFPLPEHFPRFESLTYELINTRDLPAALAAVPTIYFKERRKIERSPAAVHAARQQHAGTVELLNEYLQDEPAPVPTPPVAASRPAPTPPRKAKAKATAPTKKAVAPGAPESAAAQPQALTFAVALSAAQQELLLLFAGQSLTLPRADVEAFARQHGALRNQLIDAINEACYARLDDVLIEESGDDYTIYETYYQRITASC